MRKNKVLTQKQDSFVQEYMIDLNATKAAIRAGYSKNNADKIGSRLVGNSRVAEAIREAKEECARRTGLTADYVIQSLMDVVRRCMGGSPVLNMSGKQVVDENNMPLWKFDSSGANRALELLGKHIGLFNPDTQCNQNTFSLEIAAIREVLMEESERYLRSTKTN